MPPGSAFSNFCKRRGVFDNHAHAHGHHAPTTNYFVTRNPVVFLSETLAILVADCRQECHHVYPAFRGLELGKVIHSPVSALNMKRSSVLFSLETDASINFKPLSGVKAIPRCTCG